MIKPNETSAKPAPGLNKPENEMLLMVLEEKLSKTGKKYYTGFMGLNSVYANESNGRLFVTLQKWPKKEILPENIKVPLAPEEDVPF